MQQANNNQRANSDISASFTNDPAAAAQPCFTINESQQQQQQRLKSYQATGTLLEQ